MAIYLADENPSVPGYSYWETTGRGTFVSLTMQQISDNSLIELLDRDYTLYGMQRLLNSHAHLGDEIYKFISDVLRIDIYILRATKDDLHPHLNTREKGTFRNSIVIIGNEAHYETVAFDTGDSFQTIFTHDHPFIKAVSRTFIGDESYNELPPMTSDEYDNLFIKNIFEIFSPNTIDDLPDISQIFAKSDPFYLRYYSLLPTIQNILSK